MFNGEFIQMGAKHNQWISADPKPTGAEAVSRIQEIDTQLASCANASERAGLLLNRANLLHVLRRMGEAREDLRLALEAAPNDPETRLAFDYLRGTLFHSEDKAGEGYAVFTEALSTHADMLRRAEYRFLYEDIQQRRAFEAFALYDCKKAIPLLEEILSFDLAVHERSAALANLGNCHAALKNLSQHASIFCKLSTLEIWTIGKAQYTSILH
jgi:tetratricopeptide (TPR) repeat protein